MKVSIITYTRTKNYGGILQAYGLYDYLRNEGYECEFIDYIPERSNIYNKEVFTRNYVSRSRFWGHNFLFTKIWQVLFYKKMVKSYEPFRNFIDTNTKLSRAYNSEAELEENPPCGDVYITGSDQVWNSDFNEKGKLDIPYYLGFINNVKKISYASSFGKSSIPEHNKKLVFDYLSRYEHLSVRESSGKQILSQIGLDSAVVVDPTVLCGLPTWNKLVKSISENNYILLYQVKFNQSLYQMTCDISKKLNKKMIIISINQNDSRRITYGKVVRASVPEWISYIKYADYIITDSFHASVFSILFHKRFLVDIENRAGMSSRITDLLEMTKLEKQACKSYSISEAINLLDHDMDWMQSDLSIDQARKKSQEWLINAINN